jgi:2-oxoglutarate dehydrogenase E2 component (dihydrolipoamide succinyltransferase)
MDENNLSVDDIINGLKRIGKAEVETVLNQKLQPASLSAPVIQDRADDRKKMTPLRKKLSERLVAVKNQTAMLTTFNEVDMSEVMALRKKYQAKFEEKHGIKVGLMSFFTKAASEALKLHPNVNSMIDGDDIITPNYTDIAIAVQTDKGLTVPVLRGVENMSLADIEKKIAELAAKARAARLSMEEMTGGTFTITNGGVFGSLLSTPIINPPQSAILGMHNILERPVAVNGQVVIRPMMYIALSYDHRIIDGKDSVGFLVHVKQFIENPVKLLFGGDEPEKLLLGI